MTEISERKAPNLRSMPIHTSSALDCAASSLSSCLDSAGGLVLQDDLLDSFMKYASFFIYFNFVTNYSQIS